MAKKKKTQTKKTAKKKVFGAARWPSERKYMARPDRYKYVRKQLPDDGCVFCHSRDGGVDFEGLCLYQSQHAMVVLNKFPYNSGHIMVIPKRHAGDLSDLDAKEYSELSLLLRRCVQIVKSEYQCEGVNIGMNMGAVAGAGIPQHLHWHIIPRWFGDTNFFPLIAETKVVPETLLQAYERYRPHFDKGFRL